MKVKAAVAYEGRELLSIEELELSEPGPDDILVRIVGCGLCHTDVKAREGMGVPKPIVLGHEGAGIVERVGERVTKVKPGDHVVLTYDSCGACRACARLHAAAEHAEDFKRSVLSHGDRIARPGNGVG